jgi:DNA-binding transcriptional LysR family regulator
MLDVKRLRVLKEVAEQGSFSAAAIALSYTQSAVSQQIAALERETGTTLVQRNARGILLTEAGEALVRHADAILTRLTDAEAELDAIAGLRGGRLRIASFSTAGSALVPKAVAMFSDRHPGVELSLVEADPEESIPKLKSGEIDVALIFEPNDLSEMEDSGIERLHLLDDVFSVALWQGHPLADKQKVKLKDLEAEAFVQPTGDCACSDIVTHACAALGFTPRVAFQSDDYLVVQGLVATGVGVALIPDLALAAQRDDIVIRPIASKPPVRQILAATLEHRSAATVAMLEVLQEVAKHWTQGDVKLAVA